VKLSAIGFLAVAALLLPQGARALTLDNTTGNASNGTARFSDPDEQTRRLTTSPDDQQGTKTYHFGNSGFSLSIGRTDGESSFGTRAPFSGFGASPFTNSFPRRPD
jgi:hypothetical protein